MNGPLIWFTIFCDLLVPAGLMAILAAVVRNRTRLRRERDSLLQEKEAALGFVHNVGEVFADSETIDLDTLLARALHYAVRTCKASSGAIYMVNAKATQLDARAVSGIFPPPFGFAADATGTDRPTSETLEKLIRGTPIGLGKGLIGEAAVMGNSILVADAVSDVRVPQSQIDFLRVRTLLAVPMRFGNHVFGVMCLANRPDGGRFASSDLSLAQALAAQASVPVHYAGLQEALEEKRQLDRDIQIAQQIQNSLLPQELPSYPTLELAAFNCPAMEIGGDYYDFVQIDDKHLGLVIADVSGKGFGGALMMAVCRSVLRVNAPNVIDPASMLCSLNQTLGSNLADDMFITMLYMVLNLETHQLSFARAGHDAPLLRRRGETTAVPIETRGIAIGLADNALFNSAIETRNISLQPGDMIVTYTDGITEAMNPAGEEWGLDNLLLTIRSNPEASARGLLDRVRQDVLAFAGSRRQYDDMTMLALEIR